MADAPQALGFDLSAGPVPVPVPFRIEASTSVVIVKLPSFLASFRHHQVASPGGPPS
jgi:hypothetical protein